MKTIALAACVGLSLAALASAQDKPQSPDRLDELPQPWVETIHRVTLAEYEATLDYWAAQHAGLFSYEKQGESHDGQPVYLLKVTDASVSDEDKQIALVSCLHGGPERSGATTALKLVEWLVSDAPLAVETRKKQIVLLVPIVNPYAFFVTDRFGNKEKIELYDPPLKWWKLKELELAEPMKTPELAAFLKIVDQYKPDMHLELHGTGLQAFPEEQLKDRTMLAGQTMFEVSACSYSNCGVRPWDPRVTDAMVQAGQEAGYGSDRAEADAQRIFWNADYSVFSSRIWIRPRPERFRTPFYGYMKYHTMISTTEIGWEESGVARLTGLLALGNKPWVYERHAGYPVDRVRYRAGRFVTSYGQTASARRASRVELWKAQTGFVDGMLYPEFDGRQTYICAVTQKGAEVLDTDPSRFALNLRELEYADANHVAKFVSMGPEYRVSADPERKAGSKRIQNGIGFRFRVPYRKPELLNVAVNGHTLSESATDGYQAWLADGYTQVQVNVPPENSKAADIFVVTVAYKPEVKRTYGWKPPEAVLKKLAGE
jgi:hypothetical protein